MKETRWIMGMPITINIVDENSDLKVLDEIFSYFIYVDEKFSTYKSQSEISKINRGEINEGDWSLDMKEVFRLSNETKKETNGYFDILTPEKKYDTNGLVKGWSIYNASKILLKKGYKNFFIDAGGDIEVLGKNKDGEKWSVGIRNPFSKDMNSIVKIVYLTDCGMATSGTYIRGQHIYNPHSGSKELNDIASITVIGQNVYEADRFATAVFAMGEAGIDFIENLDGFDGYSINSSGIATETSGFDRYTKI